ncbi:hypothetical protein BpHYR1_050611 [Brachionus plicatilis]|uniref:Uncharacterized protein n=1 Tax=Brachionus plicatilis TaxID=10195 RepID=A0A3M7S469_BRAPC|nr:hypothetical protein BpHYR1_050611 [Brachionus plicatilis]
MIKINLKVILGQQKKNRSFNYEFPISMAQSINQDLLSNENDNDQDQAESINNDIQTIVQPTTFSNLAPRKRGHPRKNP